MDLPPSNVNLTLLLQAAADGDRHASEELLPAVYEELRRIARWHMSHERPGISIQATDLVNEAYLRLIGSSPAGWNSRAHFLGAAAAAMRRILIERARAKKRTKRGGDWQRVPLEGVDIADEPPADEVLGVAAAVEALEREDPRKGLIVNLRYFAGFSNDQTADAMGLSVRTIEREWRFIRAFLIKHLRDEGQSAGDLPPLPDTPPQDPARPDKPAA